MVKKFCRTWTGLQHGSLAGGALLLFVCMAALHAQSTMQRDLERRNPAITWPTGYDPRTALLFSHNDLVMPVPCDLAFQKLTRAEKWPGWLVFASDVQTPEHAPLTQGMTFSWSIFGNPIRSNVRVYEPSRQIGWLNEASHYYQAWLFEPRDRGCQVTTEEIGVGDSARHAAAIGDERTHRAHDLWLASLRWIAEGGTELR